MKARVVQNILTVLPCAWIILLSGTTFAAVDFLSLQEAFVAEDFQKVLRMSDKMLKEPLTGEDRLQVLYYQGISQLRLGEYEKARRIFTQLWNSADQPSWQDCARMGIIDSLSLEGRYDAALIAAQSLLEQRPDSEFLSLFHLKLARAHLKLANWEEAEKHLKRIIQDYPDSLEAHTARQLMAEQRYFSVQVGAFLERERAERLMAKLKNKGEYAFIVGTEDRNGQVFYRVRVGEFVRLEDAQQMKAKLTQEGYPTRIYP